MSQSETLNEESTSLKTDWEPLDHSDPVTKRIDMWLKTCNCGDDKSPYCTYCTILWDAKEYIEGMRKLLADSKKVV